MFFLEDVTHLTSNSDTRSCFLLPFATEGYRALAYLFPVA